MHNRTDDIGAVALLDEPVRRALYEWVAAADRAVGRDEAAAALGIGRALAAFHLERLMEAGLLVAEYRRLSGRSGPGAGRPAKLYRRAPRDVRVSLPERRYDVAAEVMAEALERVGAAGEAAAADALRTSAERAGETLGAAARRRAGPRPGRRRLRQALVDELDERGYEPRETSAGEIRLANCPFHALVEDHRQLVCGMNLALADGLLDGLGDAGVTARLDPQPGQCCVAFGRSEAPAPAPDQPPD